MHIFLEYVQGGRRFFGGEWWGVYWFHLWLARKKANAYKIIFFKKKWCSVVFRCNSLIMNKILTSLSFCKSVVYYTFVMHQSVVIDIENYTLDFEKKVMPKVMSKVMSIFYWLSDSYKEKLHCITFFEKNVALKKGGTEKNCWLHGFSNPWHATEKSRTCTG